MLLGIGLASLESIYQVWNKANHFVSDVRRSLASFKLLQSAQHYCSLIFTKTGQFYIPQAIKFLSMGNA